MGNEQSFCFVVTIFLYSPPRKSLYFFLIFYVCFCLASVLGYGIQSFVYAGQVFHH